MNLFPDSIELFKPENKGSIKLSFEIIDMMSDKLHLYEILGSSEFIARRDGATFKFLVVEKRLKINKVIAFLHQPINGDGIILTCFSAIVEEDQIPKLKEELEKFFDIYLPRKISYKVQIPYNEISIE